MYCILSNIQIPYLYLICKFSGLLGPKISLPNVCAYAFLEFNDYDTSKYSKDRNIKFYIQNHVSMQIKLTDFCKNRDARNTIQRTGNWSVSAFLNNSATNFLKIRRIKFYILCNYIWLYSSDSKCYNNYFFFTN